MTGQIGKISLSGKNVESFMTRADLIAVITHEKLSEVLFNARRPSSLIGGL